MSAQLLAVCPRFRMVATDCDTEVVGMAEQVLAGFGRRASAQRADAAQLPFPDSRFDLVLSAAMLHHVIDWDQALAEAVRVLRPGGKLIGYDMLNTAPIRLIHLGERDTTILLRADQLKAPGQAGAGRPADSGLPSAVRSCASAPPRPVELPGCRNAVNPAAERGEARPMDRLTLTPQELDYLRSQRLGRLATVDGRGAPQNSPLASSSTKPPVRCSSAASTWPRAASSAIWASTRTWRSSSTTWCRWTPGRLGEWRYAARARLSPTLTRRRPVSAAS